MVSSELESPELTVTTALIETEANSLQLAESSQDSVTAASCRQAAHPTKPTLQQELEIFASTFFTIFLAELGDKTQLTTLLMSAQSQAPWVVFLGAGAALVLTSLLGVLVGRWLAHRICPQLLETATGAILLLISVLLLWDVVQL